MFISELETDFKFQDPDKWPLHDIDPLQNNIEGYSKDEGNKKLRIATTGAKENHVYFSSA